MLYCGAILLPNHLPTPYSHECLIMRRSGGRRPRISDDQKSAEEMKVKTICAFPHLACASVVIPKLNRPELAYLWSRRLPHSRLPQDTLYPIFVTDWNSLHNTAYNLTIPNLSLFIDLLVICSNSCYVILNGCYTRMKS